MQTFTGITKTDSDPSGSGLTTSVLLRTSRAEQRDARDIPAVNFISNEWNCASVFDLQLISLREEVNTPSRVKALC